MKTKIALSLLLLFIGRLYSQKQTPKIMDGNLLANITQSNLDNFSWLNEPGNYTLNNGELMIEALEGSDFFNNPEDGQKTGTAPLLFQEISGDFVVKALVKPDFSSQWNAVALMVYIDEDHWIKFAFENSDATGPSIVTVVTKKLSDDANGVVLEDTETIWLKLIRKGDNYSILWSKDDTDYKMARMTTLPESTSVKVGIEAQSPVGPSAKHKILFFGLEQKTVEDLRKGI